MDRWQEMVSICLCSLDSARAPFEVSSSRHTRSQSRMRGDYLFYEEKVETTQEERDIKAARR